MVFCDIAARKAEKTSHQDLRGMMRFPLGKIRKAFTQNLRLEQPQDSQVQDSSNQHTGEQQHQPVFNSAGT